MYWNDNEKHFTPHVHVFYAEFQASVDFNGCILGGSLPKTASKLTKKWILKNRDSLKYSWELAKECKPTPKIKGLQ